MGFTGDRAGWYARATGVTMSIRDRVKELRRVRASEIEGAPWNFRTHPERQQDAVAASLEELGFFSPLDCYEPGPGRLRLIDGHLRRDLMERVGPDTVIPVSVTDLDEGEAKKATAYKDPLAAMAEADAAKLDALLRDVKTGDPALQEMLAGLADGAGLYQTPAEVVEDDVPDPPADPVTRPGDLWILGEHRLLCGDSTKAEDMARVMQGERAALCFTSPPYAQQRDYGTAKEHVQDWDALMVGVFGCLPMADDGQVLVNLGLVHRDGEWLPYWDVWIEWMRSQGWRRFGWYVWDQGPGLPGDWNGRLAPSHEFVFHFNRAAVRPEKWIEKKPDSIVAPHGTGLRNKDGKMSGWTSPDAFLQPNKIPDSVLRIMRHKARGDEVQHAAVFSVELPAFVMQCWPGVVYEPFSGSGTTIIAGEQLGRRVRAVEIDPTYCDVAISRWEKLTGGKATLAAEQSPRTPMAAHVTD